MTSTERKRLLDSFGSAPVLLCGTLHSIPKKMWRYKSASNSWSIHDQIIHLANCEAVEYIGCRTCVAEPGNPVQSFDAAAWASRLGYFHQSTHEALQIIVSLRSSTHGLLTSLPESLWRSTFAYSQHGLITLETWLQIREREIQSHILHMCQTHTEWARRNPSRKARHRPAGVPVSSTT